MPCLNCCIYGGRTKRGFIMLALYLAYLDEENDIKLFEEIYNSYKNQMVTLALSILKSNEDAEDIVNDVFLNIAQKNFDVVRSIKNNVDLRNYLLKATKNTALNKINVKKRENVSLNTVDEYKIDKIALLSDDDFLDVICNKINYNEIIEAIKSLSDKYRDVLYYHFVLELSIPQTAKSLNQTLSTTKQRLVRGKKLLLNLLGLKGDENNGNK